MSRHTLVRSVRTISIATVGALLIISMGSASAAPVRSSTAPESGTIVVSAQTSSRAETSVVAISPRRAVAIRAEQAAKLTRYATFTMKSKATKDMRGIERSLYRGKYYRPSVERLRQCIADRESEGYYDVTSSSGLYFGAYQVSRALARGATWMMLREHKKLMGAKAATAILEKLRATPMNRWLRYWQDAAFSTIMNWESTGSGRAHWAGGRWRC